MFLLDIWWFSHYVFMLMLIMQVCIFLVFWDLGQNLFLCVCILVELEMRG